MHPFAEHRQSKVEKSRVGPMTKGYTSGGAVHSDAAEDRQMVKGMVKNDALKAEGDKPKHRSDRPMRAKGGRVKKPSTTVNVMVGQPPHAGLGPMAPPAAVVPPPMAAMPPGPPMAPPPGVGPGMPPGAPGLPPRAAGGRTYKTGGRVGPASMRAAEKDAEAESKSGDKETKGPSRGSANRGSKVYEAGVRAGTAVSHDPGKNDLKDLDRGRPITYQRGGAVEAPKGKKGMGPDFDAGALTGEGRIEKIKAYGGKR